MLLIILGKQKNVKNFEEKKMEGKTKGIFEKIRMGLLETQKSQMSLLFFGLVEHSFICFLFDCPPWTILGI